MSEQYPDQHEEWIPVPRQVPVVVELSDGGTFSGKCVARHRLGRRYLVEISDRLTGDPRGSGFRSGSVVAFQASCVKVVPTQR